MAQVQEKTCPIRCPRTTFRNVLSRHQTKGTKRGTLISKILRMTVDVLHRRWLVVDADMRAQDERSPVIGLKQILAACLES